MTIQFDTINGVIGDISYFERFSRGTPGKMESVERIQLHLKYVDGELAGANTDNLTNEQKQRRALVISKLNQYRLDGRFPQHNKRLGERKSLPRFIDHEGTYCAVGHLMAETGYTTLAQEINNDFEYEFVENMDSSALLQWADAHGLSTRDCAMIQPVYPQFEPPFECASVKLWGSISERKTLTALRALRDENLDGSRLGRLAIRGYYKISPRLSMRIDSSPLQAKLLKIALTPLVSAVTFAKRMH